MKFPKLIDERDYCRCGHHKAEHFGKAKECMGMTEKGICTCSDIKERDSK